MRPLLALLLVLCVGLTGCQDNALTDGASMERGAAAPAPAALKAGPPDPNCPANPSVSVNGPANIVAGRSAVFTATMDSRCSVSNVQWTISPASAGTLSATGASVTVTPTANFTLTARVIYNIDNIATGSRSVTYGPNNVVVQLSSAPGALPFFRVGWAIPSDAATVTLERATKDTSGNTTRVVVATGGPALSVYTDNAYIVAPSGPFNVTYIVTVKDAAGITIAQGSNSARGDTAA